MSFGDELSDENRKLRLGCLKHCQDTAVLLRTQFIGSLPEHKAFLEKGVGDKESFCEREFQENSKVYFCAPAEPAPLIPVTFVPPLEYTVQGYMNMVNAPMM